FLLIILPINWRMVLIFINLSHEDEVTQSPQTLSIQEGAASTIYLKCTYSYGATPYLFWYIQYPNQGLQLLLKYVSGNPLVKGINGFEAKFNKTQNSFHLRKFSAQRSDSAEYFCAVNAQ
uniref:Ig-like domain-containing protein n=1 Tax=Monodelphis domestica TaxID=13616 RepID=K7E0I4_MONDO